MLYYSLCAILLISSRLHFRQKHNQHSNDDEKIYLIIWGIVLILLCGLRSINIGIDTHSYEWSFNMASKYDSFISYINNYSFSEYGYKLLEYIFSQFLNFRLFLITISIISIAPVVYVTYRYSNDWRFSLFLYISFGYFSADMCFIRQMAAIGFTMIAFHCAKEKKLFGYIIMIFTAVMFHSSAWIFLPVYWINKIPYKRIVIFISVVLAAVSLYYKDLLGSYASNFARIDYGENDTGGVLMYIFMLLTVILGFVYRNELIGYNSEQSNAYYDNKELLYCLILGTIIWPIASRNTVMFRMYYYYHIFVILFIPNLISKIKDKTAVYIIKYGYVLVGLYYIFSFILPEQYMYNPYSFL